MYGVHVESENEN